MNRPVKIALGCLLAPIGFAVLGLFILLGAKTMGVPDPRPAESNTRQPIPEEFVRVPRTDLEASPGPGAATVRGVEVPEDGQIKVVLDLEQGIFRIHPGPAEDGIQVDAQYDEASYELTQRYDYESGIPVYFLKFESKISLLRRLMQDGSVSDEELSQNEIDITLPRDTPIDLTLKISTAAASRFDLTGLSLTSVDTRLRMGEYELYCTEPNPVAMGRFAADLSMGEMSLEGLGYLAPARVEVRGSMGEIDVELGDRIAQDIEVLTHMKMGEMTVRVPDNVRWDPRSTSTATMGEVRDETRDRGEDLDPELSPTLLLDAKVLMGELVLRETRAARPRGSIR